MLLHLPESQRYYFFFLTLEEEELEDDEDDRLRLLRLLSLLKSGQSFFLNIFLFTSDPFCRKVCTNLPVVVLWVSSAVLPLRRELLPR